MSFEHFSHKKKTLFPEVHNSRSENIGNGIVKIGCITVTFKTITKYASLLNEQVVC